MSVTTPTGFVASGVHCGIRKHGRLDLSLVRSLEPATGAAMFTSNRMLAAPVVVDVASVPSRVLGFGGSCSRIVRRISSTPAWRNCFLSNGDVPVSSS